MKKFLFLFLILLFVFYLFLSCAKNATETPNPVTPTIYYTSTITTTPTVSNIHTITLTQTPTFSNTSTFTITQTHTLTSTPVIVEIKCIGTPANCTNIQDTVIIENNSNNFGQLQYASLGYTNTKRRILIKFDLSSIPSTAIVVEARLIFYIKDFSHATSNPFTVSAHKLNSYWGELTETWTTHNGGDFENGSLSFCDVTTAGGWVMFLPISLIQGWINNSIPNNGILLKQQVENIQNDYIEFTMKEYYEENQRPYLIVKYIN